MNKQEENKLERLCDVKLVKLAQGGNGIASNVLLNRHKAYIYYKAKRFYHHSSEFDDILQEGLIGLYRAIEDYSINVDIPFIKFAEICIERNIISYIKSMNRLKHAHLNNYISFDATITEDGDLKVLDIICDDTEKTPANFLVKKDLLYKLNIFLKRELTQYEYQVLFLYVQSYSYDEIAKKLKRNNKSVDNTIQRIRRKLRRVFNTRFYSDLKEVCSI